MDDNIDALFLSSVNVGHSCIQVFNITHGRTCIKSFRGASISHRLLCPIGSADYIISGQKDRPLLQAWALNQNEALQMKFQIPGKVNTMAVSQSHDKFCAIGIEEKIFVYLISTGAQIGTIEGHYQGVTCLKFLPCGNYLVSAGDDGFVFLWSIRSLINSLHKADRPQIQPYYKLGQHTDKVTDVAISKAGMRGILVSCSLDHSAKIFDLTTGHLRHNIVVGDNLTSCVCNSIGSQLFFASDKGRVWGLSLFPQNSKKDIVLEGSGTECHSSAIHHLAITSSGDVLISGGADGEVKLWSIVINERQHSLGAPALAPLGSIWGGKGPISNLLIMNIDSEVLHTSSLDTRVVVSPFSKENTTSESILSASVLHPVPRKPMTVVDSSALKDLAINLLLDNSRESTSKSKKQKKRHGVAPENYAIAEPDLLAHVQKLQTKNEELYKLCLKYLVGESSKNN